MSERAVIEAVVQVGAVETPYLRCGSGGTTVVVLAASAAERSRLMSRFGGTHRVVAPVGEVMSGLARRDGAGIVRWLRGVIDGLGLERPAVALTPELAWLAERLVWGCGDALDIVLTVAPADS